MFRSAVANARLIAVGPVGQMSYCNATRRKEMGNHFKHYKDHYTKEERTEGWIQVGILVVFVLVTYLLVSG